MADALISFVIDQLASTALEQIKENVRLVLDVEKEVDQFIESLKTIQAVLKDAEKRRVKEAIVQDWLDKLKRVSYDMDNVLDEWNTQALKQQTDEKQENEGESALVNKKKVRFSIPSPSNCFCFGQASSRIVVRHDIAQTIKQLNIKLTSIAEERHKYDFQSTPTSGIEEPQRPKTSSLVDVSEIFGRENEKRDLISMLLGHSTSTSTGEEERGPLVIPVVGMGGMGKTTLAQLAYNDEEVKAHFEKSIWVCVSEPFDEIKIAKAIIGKDDTPISDEWDALMQSVSNSVKRKRFLLVLDDVWTEDDTKWKQLKLALKFGANGAKGSRILVTTRKETVARMMGATTHMIHLEKLSEQICSSLFYYIAFLDRENDKTDLFEAIGNKIVSKCNGLPLAAKTLGSLMRYKNTPQEWRDVFNDEMWQIEEIEQKVFLPLLLSYYDLASEIKPCLLLCASFPKDHEINKNNLIDLWMSHNYLNSKIRNKEKRAIGQKYFDDLVMRSFFQDFQMDDYGNIRNCKMHDIVHDFVQFLTRNECCIIEVNGANQATVLSSDSVRHLTLMSAAEGPLSLPTPFHTCQKLRSLTTFSKEITRIDGDLILQLKCLRALNLREINVREVPKEIGELLHLRYIDLSRNYSLKELPDTMCNLCNLETLHLENCWELKKLPKAMGKLINLKHLYLEYSGISGLPKGVGRLRGLRILDRFVCGGGDDKEILELGDLGSFEHLQGTTLEIRGLGNVKDVREQAQKAQLEKKKHLLELTLDFGDNSGEQQRISDEDVLNALRPPPDLKSLFVWYYQGGTLDDVFGNWMMSLQHLTHLTLYYFEYCESLPPLGKLPYLEVLDIRSMPRVEKVGVELLGIEETQTSPATAIAFPKLKRLLFVGMERWEEWEGVGDDCQVTIMPCLSSLYIWSAPKLKQVPDFLLHNRPLLELDVVRRGKALSSIP